MANLHQAQQAGPRCGDLQVLRLGREAQPIHTARQFALAKDLLSILDHLLPNDFKEIRFLKTGGLNVSGGKMSS